MPVEHISDTARWVAFYRALETERPDAIFRDPWARRLAGARGEEIVRRLPRARSNAWAMIVRTALFDEIILCLIEREGADLVLDLAAGLDTRAFRLPLPAGLRWVDVDLPAILAHKREVEFRSSMEEARRLRREMPMAWLWRAVGRLASAEQRERWRRAGGVVLLERA